MLNHNKLVKKLLIILLSTSNFNLFCAATPDTQVLTLLPKDSLYYNILHKLIPTDLKLYQNLKTTADNTGNSPITKEPADSGIKIITKDNNVFISLDQNIIDCIGSNSTEPMPDDIKNQINKQYNKYLLSKCRPQIMEIIQEIAPELYAKIKALDSNFSQHIIAGDGLAILSIQADGLPIIKVDTDFMNSSKKHKKLVLLMN